MEHISTIVARIFDAAIERMAAPSAPPPPPPPPTTRPPWGPTP
jgi:hypothetical protein